MAKRIEADGRGARLAAATKPSSAVQHSAALDLPAPAPAKAPGAGYAPPATQTAGAPKPEKKVAKLETAPHAAPAKPKETKSAAAPKTSADGHWRIQLGAFRDENNAHALWSKIGGKTGGRVNYIKAGDITKVQATGFASKAAAQAACGKAATACVVVAP